MMEKIIHHFVPEDKNLWHPVWKKCLESWFIHFPEPEYEHKFWYNSGNKNDAITDFVKNEYPEYLNSYSILPLHIMKIDFVKFLVIYKYGGLYVDMDIYCYKNFYHMLSKDIVLLEAFSELEVIQNSMFGGKKNNHFYINCVHEIINAYHNNKNQFDTHLPLIYDNVIDSHRSNDMTNSLVHRTTGSLLLSEIYKKYDKENILVLKKEIFNPSVLYYDKFLITKHMLTGIWGKDTFNLLNSFKNKNDSCEEHLRRIYIDFRNIDINNFDFYRNYSNE